MLEERDVSRTGHRWRRTAVLAGILLVGVAQLAWRFERRSVALREEIRTLRTLVAARRDLIARQRLEMAEVAAAVDRVARTASVVRVRSQQVRSLAHVEEAHDRGDELFDVATRFDGGTSIVSEEGARALQELAWLDGEVGIASDSLTLMTTLLREERPGTVRAVPTMWPVLGSITSPFGTRMSPWGDGPESHAGIDIAGRYGFPVMAAGAGDVVFAGRDAGYGTLVVIDHGGQLQTLYAHLSAFYVHEGQRVRRGQPIGAIGDSGRATGAHLHYEVRLNGAPVDPLRYLHDTDSLTAAAH